MENKKAMSDVVTTLIIILLAIVALGIIWMVVKGVLQGSSEQVKIGDKCREVEIQATKVNDTSAGAGTSYALTLHRTGTGEEISDVRVVLYNDVTNSVVLSFGAIDALGTLTKTLSVTPGLVNVNKVEMTAIFTSELGEEQICPTTMTTEF